MTTLASGAALGVIYALIGVAVATVALATRTLHLAIGPILVAGTLISVTLDGLGWPVAAAVTAGMAVGAVASALLDPLVLRPLGPRSSARREVTAPTPQAGRLGGAAGDHAIRWLVGLAVAGAIVELLVIRHLTVRQFRPRPLLGGEGRVSLAGVEVPSALLVALVIGGLVAATLAIAVTRTRWGARLRLVGGSPAAAELAGISPARVRVGALAVSGALGVLAGVLAAPVTFVSTAQGAPFTVRGVAAASVLGGAPRRVVAAGLLLGLTEAAAQATWPQLRGDIVVGAVVLLVLAVRGGDRARGWARVW